MDSELYFWLSIVSTILAFVFLAINVWLISAAKREKERRNSQVKIWQHSSQGIAEGLRRTVVDADSGRFTSAMDLANTVWSLQAAAFSLYQSFYDERTKTEEEYKQEQKELNEELKLNRKQQSSEEQGSSK